MRKIDDYQDYDEYEEEDYDFDEYNQDYEDDSAFIGTLAFISKWFIRIGIVIAAILFIFYLIKGQVASALLFILGLIVAYFFGYGFMFLLDRIVDSN